VQYRPQKKIQAARNKQPIFYGKIAEIMGLPQSGDHMARETGQILGEIGEYEHTHNRPLLSAVVVRSDKEKPGKGFFTLARELGELEENIDEGTFWKREIKRVYDTWS
jgi:alkylated DNA nucleotide flippase Atl1